MLEVEFRAKLSKKKYDELHAFLQEHGENLGEDNKDCYYYILPDRLVKVVQNTSKKTAKVSLKLNRIGNGASFPEYEFSFDPGEFERARQLFNKLGLPGKIMHGPQERTNYAYKDCEIALKLSDAWGYHLEIEQVVPGENQQQQAEAHIRAVAQDLGVELMSEEALKAFTEEAERGA